MSTLRINTVVELDGEIHLKGLPYHKGDRVEAVLQTGDSSGEQARREAVQRLLESSRQSTFRSAGPYPSRDELHERA